MKKRILLWIGVAAVFLAAIAISALRQTGYVLPGWIDWQEKELSGDCGTVTLAGKRLAVRNGETVLFSTDRKLPVQDVLVCDMDRDGEQELMLLCWKRGRYGDSRPFWVRHDPQTWSQHIYIYDWTDEAVTPIWMASDIGLEAAAWTFDESTRLVITDRQGEQSAWDWVSWGLSSIPLQKPRLTVAAVGDNLIHRQLYDYAFRHFDGDFSYLYAPMAQELAAYDLVSINQETPLVEDPGEYGTYPSFGTPIQVGEAVAEAGFDLVTCATNHALDRGVAGIDRTAALFRQQGVVCAGIQESTEKDYRPYELLERNGIRAAVFSYTQMTNGRPIPKETPQVVHLLQEEQVRQDLALGRENADLLLVYVHWGTEYQPQPDETQLWWAQLFADCGVHVVIGTHPHVLQPVEWVTGEDGWKTLVYYSLGNYISAQEDPACQKGGLAWFTAEKDDLQCRITDWGLKTLVTTSENGLYTTKLTEETEEAHG